MDDPLPRPVARVCRIGHAGDRREARRIQSNRNGDPDVWMSDRISELKRRFRKPEQAEPIFDLAPEEPEPATVAIDPAAGAEVTASANGHKIEVEPLVMPKPPAAQPAAFIRKYVLCFEIDGDGTVYLLNSLLEEIKRSIEAEAPTAADDEENLEFLITPKWMTQEEYDALPDG